MSDVMRVRDTAGPFYMKPEHYAMGFDWEEELELIERFDAPTHEIPQWAYEASPMAGIAGTWRIVRHRLRWHKIPVSGWRDGGPSFVPRGQT